MASNLSDRSSLYNFVILNGLKSLVDLGLREVPEIHVQPPEKRPADKLQTIISNDPPIDLSKLDGPYHDQVVEDMARAAATVGFLQLVNHGVPLELLESLEVAARRFHDQPPEKKAVYREGASPSPLVQFGTSIIPDKEEVLDWKDYLCLEYTHDSEALRCWPMECKDVALEYLKASHRLARRILEVLLGKLGVKLDDSKLDALIGFRTIFMNYSPPCPSPDITVATRRHSDLGTITVLLQDDVGGLHVKLEDGKWMEIPPIPGALVINVGDTLQILSNGRYRSVEHEVHTSTRPRVSISMFTNPFPTEKIGPLPQAVGKDGVPRYGDVLFVDYMKTRYMTFFEGNEAI